MVSHDRKQSKRSGSLAVDSTSSQDLNHPDDVLRHSYHRRSTTRSSRTGVDKVGLYGLQAPEMKDWRTSTGLGELLDRVEIAFARGLRIMQDVLFRALGRLCAVASLLDKERRWKQGRRREADHKLEKST